VKSLRLWLLVLLAVLLPVRGAMAAAMLCAPAGVGTQSELRLADAKTAGHHHEAQPLAGAHDHAAHAHAHSHADATHDRAAGGHHDAGSAQDRCNLCSALCSVTSLPSTPPTLPAPQELGATAFPALSAAAPSFFSGGPERPPRTC
jgi:hypothetical protein